MEERRRLIEKLVVHGHLNVSERQILGTVTRLEIADQVKLLLSTRGAFPVQTPTGAVYEGATLHQIPAGVKIVWNRAYPWNPLMVAESRTENFPDVDSAIEKFIDIEWNGSIDGIILR